MKKLLTITSLILVALLFTGCGKKDQSTTDASTPTKAPTPTPPETQLPPEERPVVDMRTDQEIHRLFFTIDNLPEDVTKIEYIVSYKAAVQDKKTKETRPVDRGGFGIYENGQTIEEEYLFGSESSGVFKYDDNVTDIMLTIEYQTLGQKILLRYPYTSSTVE